MQQQTHEQIQIRLPLRETITLAAFLAVLYILQFFYAYAYAHTALKQHQLFQILFRLFVWILPVFIFLKAFGYSPLDSLKLRKNIRRGFVWGSAVGLILLILHVAGLLILHGRIRWNASLGIGVYLKAVILVGFSEEPLFRGLILMQLNRRMRFLWANVIAATLFVLIHIPGWILLNQLAFPASIGMIGYLFVFALTLGWILKKSGSLWSCILIHSMNNFCSLAILAASNTASG